MVKYQGNSEPEIRLGEITSAYKSFKREQNEQERKQSVSVEELAEQVKQALSKDQHGV